MFEKIHSLLSSLARKTGFPLSAWAIFLFLAGLKVFLVSGQDLTAFGNAKHDDQLFVKLAASLLKFQWLGEFNNLTLAKGPFYSMWIAFSNFLHVPLLLSQHLLYIFACLVLAVALKPLFSKIWPLIAIYAIVLFNPMNYTDGTATRVTREGVYQSLALFVIALFIGLMLRLKHSPKKIFLWSLSGGLALSAFWLTREEGVWILPFVVPAAAYCSFFAWKKKIAPAKKRLLLCAMPFAILILSICAVSAVNYIYYKSFNAVEFKAPEFLAAYGALTRVKSNHWMRNVPVSKEKRMLIYEVSPAFAELQKSLEGKKIGGGWTKISNQNAPSENNGEIKGGWFMWALRDAVQSRDFYKNGRIALDYYARLADEVNFACEKKELDCYPERSSMLPPWSPQYNRPFLESLQESIVFLITFKDFNAVPSASLGKEENLELFRDITREKLSAGSVNGRINALARIGRTYQAIFPYLLALSALLFLSNFFRKQFWERKIWWISLFLIFPIAARIAMVSLIHATSFPAIGNQYMSPVYSLVLLFTLLNLLSPFVIKENH